MALSLYDAVYEVTDEFGEDQVASVTIKFPREDSEFRGTRIRVRTKSGKTWEYVKLSPGVYTWRKRILV